MAITYSMTPERKKEEFQIFCNKQRWHSNVAQHASSFFGVSEAAIRKWERPDGKIPDSAMRLMQKQYDYEELLEDLEQAREDSRELKIKTKGFFSRFEELKELVQE